MKIYCEKCGEELSPYVDRKIISFSVGQLVCPKCQKKQSRYISQTDLQLFLCIAEVAYLLILLFTLFLYEITNFSLYTLLALIPLFALVLFSLSRAARIVYEKAPGKNTFKDYVFKEDPKHVNKGFYYRVIVFTALAMTILSNEDIKYYAAITLAITVGLSFLKYYLCLREEKINVKFKKVSKSN